MKPTLRIAAAILRREPKRATPRNMHLTGPVRSGRFLKRYERFFADVELDGEVVVAHVPNTGSLKTCLFPEADSIITMSNDPARKLKATLHFLKTPTGWVGVDTGLPNALVHELWREQRRSEWASFKAARREFKLSKETRLDLVLAPDQTALDEGRDLHFIEIKNVTMKEAHNALFPDAETKRGQKHLQELILLKQQGFGAEIVFVVQRQDCQAFAPADAVDPEYGRLLRAAHAAGVTVTALALAPDFEPTGHIRLSADSLPVIL